MTTVAVVQATPVHGNTPATLTKVASLIREVGQHGGKLTVFPEAFVGGYPKGSTFGAVVGTRSDLGRDEFADYMGGAISLDGDDLEPVIEAALEAEVFVVLGVIERVGNTLYCTAVMLNGEGVVGKHRKLMPTASERLIWGFGDGSTLDVVDSPAGKVGTAICWENYMPLFRAAMYAKGVQVYCTPTVDDRDSWQSTMQHIALEGRTFVLSSCQYVSVDDYPQGTEFPNNIGVNGDVIRGGSVIIDPLGTILAGPVYGEEAILYAEIDLNQKDRAHFDLDATGHYARPDVFELHVNTAPKDGVIFS